MQEKENSKEYLIDEQGYSRKDYPSLPEAGWQRSVLSCSRPELGHSHWISRRPCSRAQVGRKTMARTGKQ